MSRRNDLDIYERESATWWDSDSRAFRSLRSVGEFHLELLCERWGSDLSGRRVADLGCGGGFLTLALAERGARLVGLDRSRGSLAAARAEAARRAATGARFVQADLCAAPLPDGCCDLVVMSDVLEHLQTPGSAVREAARLLRPGGELFVNTFDRGPLASLLVVHLAEGLGLVPRGTHDPRLFVRPAELEAFGRAAGLALAQLSRERPRLWRTVRTWTIHLERAEGGPGYSAFLAKPSRG